MVNRDVSLQIGATAIDEIKRLHNDILGHARQSLSDAIRVGELLTQVKAVLKHGEWLDWLKQIPFNDRTARRYVSCYERRDQLKTDNVANLSEAYALIASNNGTEDRQPQHLHESNFWTRNTKFGQSWWGGINQEFKDHPLETWRRDQWQSMAATLEPFAELYQRLKSLIG